MSALSAFGLFAVTAMMLCYALEQRSRWYTLGFASACGLGSVYGFLQGAWPFGIVEAVWMLVAAHKWYRRGSTAAPKQQALIIDFFIHKNKYLHIYSEGFFSWISH